ncbi:Ig-like domain-containing protein [Clostridium botulinum]|uniref:SbsA Ig-like domain-containing protein n=1 Tax=Clostridium botulinum TaxID=1491 RepID=A0A9Q1UWZ3_CLOBO|nr:Ig-like domain-containing protein [Clostridium botulinum]AEB75375.1 hypothetical protein CbC4_0695 [Clostridium botulinum BKT015925]KEI03930.1 hypothetical protein Y848_03885 [Clostridium botulinum C/D str. Sp77]KLU77127.1 hypothetical protein CBC3_00140 [Clostridium botulinum V891]KOA73564.1 hypothetical protein ADU78_12215 [Clostridium botulinum]KOA79728.1 hypothetical protein ADU77_03205 [Clostridium botulinum]
MSNNKTLKVFSSTAVAGMIAAAMMSSQAFAAVDAYSVKVGDEVYKYDRVELEKSFLDSKAGDKAALYEDFTKKLGEAKGFYAFNDTKNGYVDYNSIEAKFLEAKNAGQKFDVNAFTESKDAKIVEVKSVKKAVVNKDGKIEYVTDSKEDEKGELKVTSVEALNLKQVKIEFNKAVTDTDKKDDIEDKTNYTLEDKDNKEITDAVEKVRMSDDKKSAIITLRDADNRDDSKRKYSIVENQEKSILTIDDSVTGKEVKKDIRFDDVQLPTVENIDVVGKDTVKVTFSEPVSPDTEKDDFEIENGDISISSIERVNDNKEVNIVLGTNLKDKQSVKVRVKSTVMDYAGLITNAKEKNVVAKEDTKAPTVIGFKDIEANKVTLVFDKDIKIKGSNSNDVSHEDLDKIYHATDSNIAESATIDGKELKIVFEDNLSPGQSYINIKSGLLESRWEVENDKIRTRVERPEDNTRPELVKVEQDKDSNKKIKIRFSEKVNVGTKGKDESALTTKNYTLKDENGKEWDIDEIKQDGDSEKEFILHLSQDLDEDLEYKLTIKNVEDKYQNAIKEVTKKFKSEDKDSVDPADVKVTVYSVGTNDQKIVVDFDTKMTTDKGRYSINDITKYTLVSEDKIFGEKSAINLSELYNSKIKVVKDGKAVEIAIPGKKITGNKELKDKQYNLKKTDKLSLQIDRVADSKGNITDRNFVIDGANFKILEEGNASIGFDKDLKPQAFTTDEIKFQFDDKVKFNNKDVKVIAATPQKIKEIKEALKKGSKEYVDKIKELKKFEKGMSEAEQQEGIILPIAKCQDNSASGNTQVNIKLDKALADKKYDDSDLDHILTYDGKFAVRNHETGKSTNAKLDVFVVIVPNDGEKTSTDNDYDETLKLGVTKVVDKIAPAIVDNANYAGIDNGKKDVAFYRSEDGKNATIVLTFEEAIDKNSVSNATISLSNSDFKNTVVDSVIVDEKDPTKVVVKLSNMVDNDKKVIKDIKGNAITVNKLSDMAVDEDDIADRNTVKVGSVNLNKKLEKDPYAEKKEDKKVITKEESKKNQDELAKNLGDKVEVKGTNIEIKAGADDTIETVFAAVTPEKLKNALTESDKVTIKKALEKKVDFKNKSLEEVLKDKKMAAIKISAIKDAINGIKLESGNTLVLK